MELPDYVFWTLIALLGIALVVLAAYGLRQRRLVIAGNDALKKKQTHAYQVGMNQASGDLSQVIGTFSVLTEYDEVLLLSSTSTQSSLDLLGIKGEELDFVEFKKDGAPLSKGQRRLRDLIESGHARINYRILNVMLPDGASIKNREN